VTVIDGATNEVVTTIVVGLFPIDFCHNPVQNRVYVASFLGSSISVLRDSGGGIEEDLRPQAASAKPSTSVVRGVLYLPSASSFRRETSSVLLDVSGRKEMDLVPGANDVRALAPGVYFVRRAETEDGRPAPAVHKVVVTR